VSELPSEHDFVVHGSLDEIAAFKLLGGKWSDEARLVFAEDTFGANEALMWMGPRAFSYYVRSASDYLKSADSSGDPIMLSGFHAALEFRANEDLRLLQVDHIREALDYLIANYDKYEVDVKTHGDLLRQLVELRRRIGE